VRKLSKEEITVSDCIVLAQKQMIFVSLWLRLILAISGLYARTARMPVWRFAAIDMPIPVQQMSTPRSAFFSIRARLTCSA